LKPLDSTSSSGIHVIFSLRAPVITVSVILDIVIVEVTVIICIMRDVTRDDLVEVSGMIAEV